MIRTIPEDFLIGTSSSAWQIEGVAGKSKEQKSWAELFYASAPENGIMESDRKRRLISITATKRIFIPWHLFI